MIRIINDVVYRRLTAGARQKQQHDLYTDQHGHPPGVGGGGGGTLTFACYRGSDYLFFWFKSLNFAIFWGVEVLSAIFMGMPIREGIFMSFSTDIFGECQFINVDFMVFLLYKVQ